MGESALQSLQSEYISLLLITSSTRSTPLDDLLSGWFCFIQLEDGRIPAVTYTRNESLLAINFKKGIVAGFQANFKGTEAVEETDPQSMHFSHYRYIVHVCMFFCVESGSIIVKCIY